MTSPHTLIAYIAARPSAPNDARPRTKSVKLIPATVRRDDQNGY
jgi:hypothetical protein